MRILSDTPPWEWPAGARQVLLDVLRDDRADESDLALAADLAGEFTVINDDLVEALLGIVRSPDRSDRVRGKAAISLGPVLEHVDTDGFEEPDDDPITERTFHEIQESLRTLYRDASVPKEVQRRILEVSVRAPQDWHRGAVRAAYATDDPLWRLTAVFCMRYVPGFEMEIREALDSESGEIVYEAVVAAGNWGLEAAWPHVAALLTSEETDKPLLLAAIDAAASIRPQEAGELLVDLLDSDDDDIAAAAEEAIAMAEGFEELDDDPDDDEPTR